MTENINEREELRSLSGKYGLAMIVLFINRLVAMPIFVQAAAMLGLMPQAGSEARYLAVLLLNEAASYIAPLVIFYAMFGRLIKEDTGCIAYKRVPCESVLIFIGGLSAGTAGASLSDVVSTLMNLFFGVEKPKEAFDSARPDTLFMFLSFLFCTVVIAPVCEELIFRHLLLKPLRKYGDMTAAVISSLIFGLYHANFTQLAYAVILGFFFSLLAIRSGSIVPCIIAHVINNLAVGIANYRPESFGVEWADKLFGTLAALIVPMFRVLSIAGYSALLLLFILKVFKLSRRTWMKQGAQVLCFCTVPLTLLGFAVMIAGFFINV